MLRFDEVIGLWREGERRLAQADPDDRRRLERVIEELVNELRRRVGGTFTTDELARFYIDQGTDWCFDIATRVAPGKPAAWDLTTVAGAAFARYVREASDYAGGAVAATRTRDRSRAVRRRPPARADGRPRRSRESPSATALLVGVVVASSSRRPAGAADDDLVLLDRDLDRAVAGPVLGVDRVVLDGGVEPQAVALLAVVEGRLERRPPCAGVRPTAAPAAAPALGRRFSPSSSSSVVLGAPPRAAASAASSSAAISASSSARRSISSSKSAAAPVPRRRRRARGPARA